MYLPPNIEEKQAIDAYFVTIAVKKNYKDFFIVFVYRPLVLQVVSLPKM